MYGCRRHMNAWVSVETHPTFRESEGGIDNGNTTMLCEGAAKRQVQA
jgi:hypothetical protein